MFSTVKIPLSSCSCTFTKHGTVSCPARQMCHRCIIQLVLNTLVLWMRLVHTTLGVGEFLRGKERGSCVLRGATVSSPSEEGVDPSQVTARPTAGRDVSHIAKQSV